MIACTSCTRERKSGAQKKNRTYVFYNKNADFCGKAQRSQQNWGKKTLAIYVNKDYTETEKWSKVE